MLQVLLGEALTNDPVIRGQQELGLVLLVELEHGPVLTVDRQRSIDHRELGVEHKVLVSIVIGDGMSR